MTSDEAPTDLGGNPIRPDWDRLTGRQKANRLATLDPGIKPRGIRERLMKAADAQREAAE